MPGVVCSPPGMGERSRRVHTSQIGPHPRLERTVRRHLEHRFRRPPADHTRAAHAELRAVLAEAPTRPVVLDSGCGNGESTRRLAARHPAAWVVGADRSAHRLDLHGRLLRRFGDRGILLRAEVGDLWRLLAADGLQLGAHYLLYPNPYPKPGHLERRWHGHPAWPALLALGGRLEARSNWRIYLEELALALGYSIGRTAAPQPVGASNASVSPFERKYRASEHELWSLTLTL